MTDYDDMYSWGTVEQNFLLPQSLQERIAVNQEFANNPEHAWLVRTLGHLDFAYQIFRRNVQKFRDFGIELRQIENVGSLNVIDDQYFDKRFDYANESSTLLVNFLSSMNMLIDVTRRLIRCEIEDKELEKQFSIQVKKLFGGTGLSSFMKDIRNFALHREVLLTMPIKIETNFEICLETTELRQWKSLKNASAEFLDANEIALNTPGGGQAIPIEGSIRDYYEAQSKLNAWLFNSILKTRPMIVKVNNKFIEDMRSGFATT